MELKAVKKESQNKEEEDNGGGYCFRWDGQGRSL